MIRIHMFWHESSFYDIDDQYHTQRLSTQLSGSLLVLINCEDPVNRVQLGPTCGQDGVMDANTAEPTSEARF